MGESAEAVARGACGVRLSRPTAANDLDVGAHFLGDLRDVFGAVSEESEARFVGLVLHNETVADAGRASLLTTHCERRARIEESASQRVALVPGYRARARWENGTARRACAVPDHACWFDWSRVRCSLRYLTRSTTTRRNDRGHHHGSVHPSTLTRGAAPN